MRRSVVGFVAYATCSLGSAACGRASTVSVTPPSHATPYAKAPSDGKAGRASSPSAAPAPVTPPACVAPAIERRSLDELVKVEAEAWDARKRAAKAAGAIALGKVEVRITSRISLDVVDLAGPKPQVVIPSMLSSCVLDTARTGLPEPARAAVERLLLARVAPIAAGAESAMPQRAEARAAAVRRAGADALAAVRASAPSESALAAEAALLMDEASSLVSIAGSGDADGAHAEPRRALLDVLERFERLSPSQGGRLGLMARSLLFEALVDAGERARATALLKALAAAPLDWASAGELLAFGRAIDEVGDPQRAIAAYRAALPHLEGSLRLASAYALLVKLAQLRRFREASTLALAYAPDPAAAEYRAAMLEHAAAALFALGPSSFAALDGVEPDVRGQVLAGLRARAEEAGDHQVAALVAERAGDAGRAAELRALARPADPDGVVMRRLVKGCLEAPSSKPPSGEFDVEVLADDRGVLGVETSWSDGRSCLEERVWDAFSRATRSLKARVFVRR